MARFVIDKFPCSACGKEFRRRARSGPYCSPTCRDSARSLARSEAGRPIKILRAFRFIGQVKHDGTEALLVPPQYAVDELVDLGFEMTLARLSTLLEATDIEPYR